MRGDLPSSFLSPLFHAGNVDYIERTNVSIIFLPGNPVRSVTLTTLSDEVIEGEETLIARLRDGPDNVDISRIEVDVTDAIVTITEDTGMYIAIHVCLHVDYQMLYRYTACYVWWY